jgi:hypothetical protein
MENDALVYKTAETQEFKGVDILNFQDYNSGNT